MARDGFQTAAKGRDGAPRRPRPLRRGHFAARVLATAALALGLARPTPAGTPVVREDADWDRLTNHLSWCQRALAQRYAAADRPLPALPSVRRPVEAYLALPALIDAVAPVFLDVGQATGGTFEAYAAARATNSSGQLGGDWLPHYTVTGLHAQAGFAQWDTNVVLLTWGAFTQEALFAQLDRALGLLRWTALTPAIAGARTQWWAQARTAWWREHYIAYGEWFSSAEYVEYGQVRYACDRADASCAQVPLQIPLPLETTWVYAANGSQLGGFGTWTRRSIREEQFEDLEVDAFERREDAYERGAWADAVTLRMAHPGATGLAAVADVYYQVRDRSSHLQGVTNFPQEMICTATAFVIPRTTRVEEVAPWGPPGVVYNRHRRYVAGEAWVGGGLTVVVQAADAPGLYAGIQTRREEAAGACTYQDSGTVHYRQLREAEDVHLNPAEARYVDLAVAVRWDGAGGFAVEPPARPRAPGWAQVDAPPAGAAILAAEDTDRDDLTELGCDLRAPGGHTGTAGWTPEADEPAAALPVAHEPFWWPGRPVVGYLAPRADPVYHTFAPGEGAETTEGDLGSWQWAWSLSTRVLECVERRDLSPPVKRASLRRPRGQLAVFDFAWAGTNFSQYGTPMGIHRRRGWVLEERGAADSRARFVLRCATGMNVEYDRNGYGLGPGYGLVRVYAGDGGGGAPPRASTLPPVLYSNGTVRAASRYKYESWSVQMAWQDGALAAVTYTPDGGPGAVTVAPTLDANRRLQALTKSGEGGAELDTSVTRSGETLAYAGGLTVRRHARGPAGTARTVTRETTVPGNGTEGEIWTYDAQDRLRTHAVQCGPDAAPPTQWTYATESGRYPTGWRRDARVTRVDYPDGAWVRFARAADTGWPAQEIRPAADGEAITEYAYATWVPGEPGGWALWDIGPDAGEWAPMPRTVTVRDAEGVVRARTLLADLSDAWEYGRGWSDRLEIRPALAGAATWESATNFTRELDRDFWDYSGYVFTERNPAGRWTFTVDGGWTGPHAAAQQWRTYVGEVDLRVSWALGAGTNRLRMTTNDAWGRGLEWEDSAGDRLRVLARDRHGPTRVREADGAERALEYDAAGNLRRETARGVTREFQRDGLGRVVGARVTAAGAGVTHAWTYDAQGRLTAWREGPDHGVLAYTALPTGTLVRVERAGRGAVEVAGHWDGRVLSVDGAGAPARRRYVYGAATYRGEALAYVREIRVAADGGEAEWTQVWSDALGRPRYVEYAGVSEPLELAYDAASRPRKLTDAAGHVTLFAYDEARDVLARAGLDRSGSADALESAGLDRFAVRTLSGAGGIVSGYPRDGDATAETRYSWSGSPDTRTTAVTRAGRTYTAARGAYETNGVLARDLTAPGGRRERTAWQNGWPASVARYGSGGQVQTQTQFDRNGLGWLLAVHEQAGDPQVRTTTLARDEHGRPVEIRPARGGSTRLAYGADADADPFQPVAVTDAEGATRRFEYDAAGRVRRAYGDGDDLVYAYDAQGRLAALQVWTGTNRTETRWTRDAQTGRVTARLVAGQTDETYTYHPDGRPDRVLRADAPPVTFEYEARSGDPTGIALGDGLTSVHETLALDRLGRPATHARDGGIRCDYAYGPGSFLTNVTVQGAAIVPDHQLALDYHPDHARLIRETWTVAGLAPRPVEVDYDEHARTSAVRDGPVSAACSYALDGAGLQTLTVHARGRAFQRVRLCDFATGLPTSLLHRLDGALVDALDYTYTTGGTRIARLARAGRGDWAYAYDAAGRLTSAVARAADGSVLPGRAYRYAYDAAGNPVEFGAEGAPRRFQSSLRNVHVTRSWGPRFEVAGEADTNAVVTVNGVRAERAGPAWHALVEAANALAAGTLPVVIGAVRQDGTHDLVQEARGTLYVPAAQEQPLYSLTGRLEQDSRWTYTWDARARLAEIASRALPTAIVLRFDYHPDGRRARKRVYEAGALVRATEYLYDGARLFCEITRDARAGATQVLEYVWGPDLSAQLDGDWTGAAAGVGGLLAVVVEAGGTERVLFPVLDHAGTVHRLLDADTGQVVADYGYDPYGAVLAESGPDAGLIPLRFNGKPYDRETALYDYGHRLYAPDCGKWLTPDPLREQAGPNQTAFCRNDPVNHIDPDGKEPHNVVHQAQANLFAPPAPPIPDVSLPARTFEFRAADPTPSGPAPQSLLCGCRQDNCPSCDLRANYSEARLLQQRTLLLGAPNLVGTRAGDQFARMNAENLLLAPAMESAWQALRIAWVNRTVGSWNKSRMIVETLDELRTPTIPFDSNRDSPIPITPLTARGEFYHSTSAAAVEPIMKNGFRTDIPNPQAAFHRNRFGRGVYLANSPTAALAERPGGVILNVEAHLGQNLNILERGPVYDLVMAKAIARGARKHGYDSITTVSVQPGGGINTIVFEPLNVRATGILP